MPTTLEESRVRNHLKETLEDLPNNLPQYNEMQLLDDLTFLLRSPLFLYAISPRLTAPETCAPPTPVSMTSHKSDPALPFELFHLEIRIRWSDDSWVAQLVYGDNVLLEGRQLNVEQEMGFVQSFFWFCEEASFLAWEYKARERVSGIGSAEGTEIRTWNVQGVEDEEWKGQERSRAGDGRGKLKLKVRFRDTEKGAAGVWRVA